MSRPLDPVRRDFLIEIARLYYEQDLSQEEIARKLDISRSSVSHLLRVCRREGIVQIRIEEPSSRIFGLQARLVERFGLREVRVVHPGEEPEATKSRVGEAAAAVLESILSDEMRIGISWGTTLFQVIRHLHPAPPRRGIEVIQLHGGLGAGNLEVDGFELARKLADKLGGTYRIVRAPMVVRTQALKEMLVREPDIVEALHHGTSADVALIGVGSNLPEISSLVRAGYLSEEESAELLRGGAVGTVCGIQLDLQGCVVRTSLNDRRIGIEPDALSRIPIRVGVAAGSPKTEAVLASLRGGYLTHLVVDEQIALRLVDSSPAAPDPHSPVQVTKPPISTTMP